MMGSRQKKRHRGQLNCLHRPTRAQLKHPNKGTVTNCNPWSSKGCGSLSRFRSIHGAERAAVFQQGQPLSICPQNSYCLLTNESKRLLTLPHPMLHIHVCVKSEMCRTLGGTTFNQVVKGNISRNGTKQGHELSGTIP